MKPLWYISDAGKLIPDITAIYKHLCSIGYRKKREGEFISVFHQNKIIIDEVYNHDLIDNLVGYVDQFKAPTTRTVDFPRKGPQQYSYTPAQVKETFVEYGFGRIFKDENYNLLTLLDSVIRRDPSDAAYFYFADHYVEVTAEKVKLHPYSAIDGKFIFKKYIIDRKVSPINIEEASQVKRAPRGHSFYNFLGRISGCIDDADWQDAGKMERVVHLMTLIGFLLHGYKQRGLTDFCVILCDDEGGGSGKGLIRDAVAQLIPVCSIDAKKEKNFDPRDLSAQTRVKVYNDVKRRFNFEGIYNEITDGGTIEYKRKHEVILSYEETWKTLILANYVIKSSSEADLRRQKVFSLEPYFHRMHTPIDEYGHCFFSDDWTDKDWNYFYNVMFRCVQLWLASKFRVDYEDPEYKARRIEASYYHEIREFIDNLEGGSYQTGDLFKDFITNDKYAGRMSVKRMTPTFFGKNLTNYLKDVRRQFSKNHNRTGITIEGLASWKQRESEK